MVMKRYKFKLKDLLLHHTEKDVIKVTIIRGKRHTHLEINEGGLIREFVSRSQAGI